MNFIFLALQDKLSRVCFLVPQTTLGEAPAELVKPSSQDRMQYTQQKQEGSVSFVIVNRLYAMII